MLKVDRCILMAGARSLDHFNGGADVVVSGQASHDGWLDYYFANYFVKQISLYGASCLFYSLVGLCFFVTPLVGDGIVES